MAVALLLALGAAALSGLWVWRQWRQQPMRMDDARIFAHGAAAALVLGLLVLGLDQHEPTHGAGLLVIFISLATGMLLFLKRQRQQAFPGALMLLHGLLGSLAVALAAWALT